MNQNCQGQHLNLKTITGQERTNQNYVKGNDWRHLSGKRILTSDVRKIFPKYFKHIIGPAVVKGHTRYAYSCHIGQDSPIRCDGEATLSGKLIIKQEHLVK